jgi:hypothetical protein
MTRTRAIWRATSAPRSASTSEGEIDAGGHAGGCPHRPVGDEDAVFLDAHGGEAGRHLAGVHPVGGGAPAVEQAGFGERERAGADRCDAARAPGAALQEGRDARRHRHDAGRAADDQRVERTSAERVRLHGEAERVDDRAAMLGQQVHLVDGFSGSDVGELEHRHRVEAHDLEAGTDDESDLQNGRVFLGVGASWHETWHA